MPDNPEHPFRPHDYEANAYKILGILLTHARDRAEQIACSAWYNRIQEQGAHGSALEVACASALIDGLRHGNWPWKIG
jgi:hypothetical protein